VVVATSLALLASCAAPKPVASKTTPVDGCHMVNVGTGLRYDCDGLTAAFHDEPPSAPVDPQRNLDDMVAALVEGFRQLADRFDAKLRVEKSAREIAGKSVLSAEVVVDHPTARGVSYASGYAVVVGHRGIVCTVASGDGRDRCAPVIRFLVEDRAP
jgi:hypothetical protein